MEHLLALNSEPAFVFRASCALIFLAGVVTKLVFLRRVGIAGEATSPRAYQTIRRAEGKLLFVLRSVGVPLSLLSIFLYVFMPEAVAPFGFALPIGLRWFGLLLGIASLIFMWWTHLSLGDNYAVELRVKEGHQLVYSGPYHWVRHPLYTATFLAGVSCTLVSANLLLLASAVIAAILYTARIEYEEAALVKAFGAQYVRYQANVRHKFIPGLY